MGSYRVILLTCLCWIFFSVSLVSAGTISTIYKYAWSDNDGYISFENVIVGSSALSGYAWSKNSGWINFDPVQGGVSNDGSGNLSGYAWGEHLGWIHFNSVRINTSTGKFSGTATGDLIGTLTFDCPQYCDVRTDWRPASAPVVSSGSAGGGGAGGGGGLSSGVPPRSPSTTPEKTNAIFEAFIAKTLSEQKRIGMATRLETVLLSLNVRGVPILRYYTCQKFHTDTFGTQVPSFTCQVAEKAQMEKIISPTNKQFNPLQSVSRIEAYSVMMKSICIHPITTNENWQTEVIKKAMELGFTVRNLQTFEPNRALTIPEMYIVVQRLYNYAKEYPTCP